MTPVLSRSRFTLPAIGLFCLALALRASAASSLVLPLVVNEIPRGDVTIVLQGEDILIREAILAAAGIRTDRMAGRIVRLPGETTHDPGHVSLSSLSPYLDYRFDEEEIVLRLNVRPDFLEEQVVDLRLRHRPPGLKKPQEPAVFLNYAAYGNTSSLGEPSYGYAGEVGASTTDFLFHSAFTSTEDGRVVRGLSRAHWDLGSILARLTLGDEFASTSAVGGAGFFGGIHFTRRFELDPWLIRTPLPSLTGAAETPTTLEVYVDGVLVRRERIQPGTFEIRNLPVATGSGRVHYVLRDSFGRETVHTSSYVVDGRLLQKGLSDFSYTLGFRRERLGTESFAYGEPTLLGYHRWGLSEGLTLGGRLELSHRLVSGGAHAILALPVGAIGLEGAASFADDRSGAAGLLSWTLLGRRIGFSLWAQTFSESYAHASLAPKDDRPFFDSGAGLSLPVGEIASATTRYGYRRMRDGGDEHRTELGLHWRLGRHLVLTTSGTNWIDAAGHRFEVFAMLGLVLSPTATAHAWGRGDLDRPQTGLTIQENTLGDTGWQYHASIVQAEQPSADLRIAHRGAHGIARVDLQTTAARTAARAEVSGALVAMGGGLHVSRPIDRSFALVRVPGIPNATIRLNHREVGRTNARGELLVPGLLSYDANRISVDADDLPFHLEIEELEVLVTTSERGGALVEFRPKSIRSVRGRIQRDESPVRHGLLVVHVDGEERSFVVGSRGQFELDLAGGVYQAQFVDARSSCALVLRIPEGESSIVELGALECAEGLP